MEDSAKKFTLMFLNKLCITCMNIYTSLYIDVIQYSVSQCKNYFEISGKIKAFH